MIESTFPLSAFYVGYIKPFFKSVKKDSAEEKAIAEKKLGYEIKRVADVYEARKKSVEHDFLGRNIDFVLKEEKTLLEKILSERKIDIMAG
jgi:hypothetical protein